MRSKLFRMILSCVVGALALTTLNAQVPATPLTVTYTYSGDPLPLPVDSADVAVLMKVVGSTIADDYESHRQRSGELSCRRGFERLHVLPRRGLAPNSWSGIAVRS